MRKKVIVFDWDGTLFDSMSYKPLNSGFAFKKVFNANPELVKHRFLNHSGLPRFDVFTNITKEILGTKLTKQQFNTLSQEFTKLNISSGKKANLFSDAIKILNKLSQNNSLVLYISSSSTEYELNTICAGFDICSRIKHKFGSYPGFSKGVEHFEKIKNIEKCSPNELLFIGDDEQDVYLGAQAGVQTLRIIRRNKTLCVDSISSLMEIEQFL